MKIEVNIHKKHMFAFVFILVAFSALFFAYAYDSSPPAPATFGHTASETGTGSNQAVGGSSTFGGGSSSRYFFSGKLGIGVDPNTYSEEFAINDTDNSGDAGMSLHSKAGTGRSYIDFYSATTKKANIGWDSPTNALLVNSIPGAPNTVVNLQSGNLGVGKVPASNRKLDVNGDIQSSRLCLSSSGCRSTWPSVTETLLIIDNTVGGHSGQTEWTVDLGITSVGTGFAGEPFMPYCALSQVQTPVGVVGGCVVYINATTFKWNLKAYRGDTTSMVVCRSSCFSQTY